MALEEIVLPLDGLDQGEAHGKQGVTSSNDAKNALDFDPTTGRRMLAQRYGHSKFCSAQINGTNPVTHLAQVTFDKPGITYTQLSNAALKNTYEWKADTPSKTKPRHIKIDKFNNLYTIDGLQGLIKYNSDAVELVRWTVNTPDPAHQIQAMDVDKETGFLFVAVTESGQQKDARMWGYSQVPDVKAIIKNEPKQVAVLSWELVLGRYVTCIRFADGKLYTIQNDDLKRRSYLVVYDDIYAPDPTVILERPLPWPSNQLAVWTDGTIYVTSQPSPYPVQDSDGVISRAVDPTATASRITTHPAFMWNPVKELGTGAGGLWSFYDAFQCQGNGYGKDDLKDGDGLVLMSDLSGSGRHISVDNYNSFFQASSAAIAPKYLSNALGGMPGLLFYGSSKSQTGSPTMVGASALTSPIAVNEASSSGGGAMIPKFENSSFCFWCLIVPGSQDLEDQASPKYDIIAALHTSPGAQGGSDAKILMLNTKGTVVGKGFDTTYGYICVRDGAQSYYYDLSNGGSVTGGKVNTPLMIVWYVRPGSAANSYVRINGTQVTLTRASDGATMSTYQTALWSASGASTIGRAQADTGDNPFDYPFNGMVMQMGCTYNYGLTAGVAASPASSGLVSQIEGHACHEYGVWNILPNSHTWKYDTVTGANHYPKPPTDSFSVATNERYLLAASMVTAKFDKAGKCVWAASDAFKSGGTPQAFAGHGYGVEVVEFGGTRYVSTVGPTYPVSSPPSYPASGLSAGTATMYIRTIVDNGNTFTNLSYFSYPTLNAPTTTIVQMQRDENIANGTAVFGQRVYIPWDDGAFNTNSVTVFFWEPDSGTPTAPALYRDTDGSNNNYLAGQAVALHQTYPNYGTGSSIDVPEFIYIACDTTGNDASTQQGLRKVRLASADQTVGSLRQTTNLAVSVGQLYKFTSSASTIVTLDAGLTNPLFTNWPCIYSVTAYGERFFTDGERYFRYNPRDDKLYEWKSKTAGKIPPRYKLIALCFGRVILARGDNAPHSWHASAIGNPYDWDTNPPIVNVAQSVDGTTSGIGPMPDIVNSLMPIGDDLLAIGGDSTIYRVTGDPMLGGSSIDLITNVTGMAFGQDSWCRDDEGRSYFAGSRGGVYLFNPLGPPRKITRHRVDRLMAAVDLSVYMFKLAWDDEHEGIHLYVVPYTVTTPSNFANLRHWFWSRRKNAWWPVTFGPDSGQTYSLFNPASALTIDSDTANDRCTVIGSANGYVQRISKTATDDDGRAIDSDVLIGPISPRDSDMRTKVTALKAILAASQGDLDYELYTSLVPDVRDTPQEHGTFRAGHGSTVRTRASGDYLWLRLRSRRAASRWAVESIMLDMHEGGRRRPR